jgi:hypothetical protein
LCKRIISLVKQHNALDRVILQRIGFHGTVKENVGVVEPQFTYNFSSRKGRPAPVITQDNEQTPPKPLLTPKQRSRRINGPASPRCAGISKAALNQFMGNTFLEKMERTIKVNETPRPRRNERRPPCYKQNHHQVKAVN